MRWWEAMEGGGYLWVSSKSKSLVCHSKICVAENKTSTVLRDLSRIPPSLCFAVLRTALRKIIISGDCITNHRGKPREYHVFTFS